MRREEKRREENEIFVDKTVGSSGWIPSLLGDFYSRKWSRANEMCGRWDLKTSKMSELRSVIGLSG